VGKSLKNLVVVNQEVLAVVLSAAKAARVELVANVKRNDNE
jgi:hypothetical protein